MMDKKLDLEVVVAYQDGEMSLGTVHELEGSQPLEVAFGLVHALQQYTDGFSFSFAPKDDDDTYILVLHISEDTGKEHEEMDEIVHSTLLLVTAFSMQS